MIPQRKFGKLADAMAGPKAMSPDAFAAPYAGPHNTPYGQPPPFQQPGAFAQSVMPPMQTQQPAAPPPTPPRPQNPALPPMDVGPTVVPPMPPSQQIGMAPGMGQPDPDMLARFWQALKQPQQPNLPPQMANGQYQS